MGVRNNAGLLFADHHGHSIDQDLARKQPCSEVRSKTSEVDSPGCTDTPATESSVLFDDLEDLLRRVPTEDQHILVTGGLGFIGSHTTLELLTAGYNVNVIDNLSNAFKHVFDRIELLASKFHEENGTPMPTMRLHQHDYQDVAALRSLLEDYRLASRWGVPKSSIASVIHFAAHKAVEESIWNPLKYFANNVSGLVDFASTLGEFGIKILISRLPQPSTAHLQIQDNR